MATAVTALTALTPAPKDIGLASPALGPWYISVGTPPGPDLTLVAPEPSLAVKVSIPAHSQWLAPATCLVSVHVATSPRPAPLAGLRASDGTPAFTNNKMVVMLTLLPEVEARLYDLIAAIPSPDGATAGTAPTRLRIRRLALEMPEDASNSANFFARFLNLPGQTPEERANVLGLNFLNNTLQNTDAPMADMRRPGMLPIVNKPDPILHFEAGA